MKTAALVILMSAFTGLSTLAGGEDDFCRLGTDSLPQDGDVRDYQKAKG